MKTLNEDKGPGSGSTLIENSRVQAGSQLLPLHDREMENLE